jgi:maleate isomerase
MDSQGARYFRDHGFEVVYHGPAGLPSNQHVIDPDQVYEWVRTHTPQSAEAVFIGGNGFRSIGAIRALEEHLVRPVLTANQVAFWQALHVSGARPSVVGYGQIFDCELPTE